jgi:hypothetical protein
MTEYWIKELYDRYVERYGDPDDKRASDNKIQR